MAGDEAELAKILDSDGTAPKAQPEDTSDLAVGEDGVPLSPRSAPGVQFISPKRDSTNGDAKIELGESGPPQFVGLGKEELMRYANDPFWVRLRWFLFILFWVLWVGMLVGAIIIIVLAPKCSSSSSIDTAPDLIKGGPYYQVALSSFSNEPNKFNGLKNQVPYLKELGVKTVIISQFQNKSNFLEIDSATGGTLDDFLSLLNALREKDIKVVLQLDPNHSSKSHEWFTKFPELYVTKESVDVKESSWKNHANNESAWSPIGGESTKSYLHQFEDSLSDLDYRNEETIKKMNQVFQYWYNVSNDIDGFLISDVSYLLEDLSDLKNEEKMMNQVGNREVLEKILDSTNWNLQLRTTPYALLDIDGLDTQQSLKLYQGKRLIPISTDFSNLNKNFTAQDIKNHIDSIKLDFIVRRLSSPRLQRVSSKYSLERANLLTMITLFLRGQTVIYYGDEIGLSGSTAVLEKSIEPMKFTRDDKENKNLEFYKKLLSIQSTINQTAEGDDGATKYNVLSDGKLFAFQRGKYIIVANLAESEASLNLTTVFDVKGTFNVVAQTPNSSVSKDQSPVFIAIGLSGFIIEVSS